MTDCAAISFWLETCGDDLTPRPSLDGVVEADIGILGAGYSGLWTAYYLLRRDPSLRIVLADAEIAGFGASGRNGSWASSGFPVSAAMLRQRYGPERARAMLDVVYESVDEIGAVLDREGIDAQFVKGGALRIARGQGQVPALEAAYRSYERLGEAGKYSILSADEVERRIQVTKARGGLFTPQCATVHPGRLVRGLARVVERMGATIYERTPVTDFSGAPNPRLTTPSGEIRARTIVLAGEAFMTRLPKLHRSLLPPYSSIVLTEPLPEAAWNDIGWAGHECVSSFRLTIDYLARTADGRILFGSRGAPYRFGSRIDPAYDHHEETTRGIQALLYDWFPVLKGTVGISHAWSGPVGMPRDFMPTAAYDPRSGIATAHGYTGQGVATSNLAGRILADLITGNESPLTSLPMANHRSRNWEPEPARWLAVRFIQDRLLKVDLKSERTGWPPTGRTLAERLSEH